MQLIIGLSVVIVAFDGDMPCVLATRRDGGLSALPFGAFNPAQHRTFELALRGWVKEQTGFQLGYVEQLYTFGDRDRESPEASLGRHQAGERIISVGYLALTPAAERLTDAFRASWRGWYRHFPWEDHRVARPVLLDELILPRLQDWARSDAGRQSRIKSAFSTDGGLWRDEAVLERYELLYEAGLAEEFARDQGMALPPEKCGAAMASDHRRILATAMSRLRAKIRYRPVIFELMPDLFTLTALQSTVEAVLGQNLHKQNFRRALERTGLVEGTGRMQSSTGGRPAELYRCCRDTLKHHHIQGLSAPVLRPTSQIS